MNFFKPCHFFLLINILLFVSASSQQIIKQKTGKVKVKTEQGKTGVMKIQTVYPLDTLAIERITGVKGKVNKGEYKITIPQNDLSIVVDGFKIIPAMGLGTWIAFTPTHNGSMIMGDIIVT